MLCSVNESIRFLNLIVGDYVFLYKEFMGVIVILKKFLGVICKLE